MVLNAAFDDGLTAWVWSFVLVSSLLSVVGFARAGSVLFWKAQSDGAPVPEAGRLMPSTLSFVAVGGLLVLLGVHTVLAGPMYRYTTATAAQLVSPDTYISTVLDAPGKLSDAKAGDH